MVEYSSLTFAATVLSPSCWKRLEGSRVVFQVTGRKTTCLLDGTIGAEGLVFTGPWHVLFRVRPRDADTPGRGLRQTE